MTRPAFVDTCNSCDAIGPVHPVTGYCADCQAQCKPIRPNLGGVAIP